MLFADSHLHRLQGDVVRLLVVQGDCAGDIQGFQPRCAVTVGVYRVQPPGTNCTDACASTCAVDASGTQAC